MNETLSYGGIISNNSIIHGPDYSDLQAHSVRVAFIVMVLIVSLIAMKTVLGSSSPTAKAVVAITVSILIAGYIIISLYMGWL